MLRPDVPYGKITSVPSIHDLTAALRRSVFGGLAQFLVQSTATAGTIKLTDTSAGLKAPTVSIATAAAPAVVPNGDYFGSPYTMPRPPVPMYTRPATRGSPVMTPVKPNW
jgi:hypothetical protein